MLLYFEKMQIHKEEPLKLIQVSVLTYSDYLYINSVCF